MSWNYRIMRRPGPDGSADYAIHEVYYGQDGEVRNWTANGVGPGGETLDELSSDLAFILAALSRPVLDQANGQVVEDVDILADLLGKAPEFADALRGKHEPTDHPPAAASAP